MVMARGAEPSLAVVLYDRRLYSYGLQSHGQRAEWCVAVALYDRHHRLRRRIHAHEEFVDLFSTAFRGTPTATAKGAGIEIGGVAIGKVLVRRVFQIDASPRRSPSARSEMDKKK